MTTPSSFIQPIQASEIDVIYVKEYTSNQVRDGSFGTSSVIEEITPASIRFSPNQKLIEGINEISRTLIMPEQQLQYTDSPDNPKRYYGVKATDCKFFFEAFIKKQSKDNYITIPPTVLNSLLQNLQDSKYLSNEEAQEFKKRLVIRDLFFKYENEKAKFLNFLEQVQSPNENKLTN